MGAFCFSHNVRLLGVAIRICSRDWCVPPPRKLQISSLGRHLFERSSALSRLLKKACFGKLTLEFIGVFACCFARKGLFQQPVRLAGLSAAELIHCSRKRCIPTMTAPRHKSKTFRLFRDGEMIVITDRNQEGVGDIIANIIIWDLVAVPFCFLFFIAGVWMLAHLPTEQDPIRNIALPVLMALFFAGFSSLMIYLLVKAQPRLLPSESRFKQDEKGEWMFQRKVWLVSLPWKRLGPDWTIWCSPAYSRGDWGHFLHVRTSNRKLWLTWSGGWTTSESEARAEGLKDLEFLLTFA
jgi:hypothetical protein